MAKLSFMYNVQIAVCHFVMFISIRFPDPNITLTQGLSWADGLGRAGPGQSENCDGPGRAVPGRETSKM